MHSWPRRGPLLAPMLVDGDKNAKGASGDNVHHCSLRIACSKQRWVGIKTFHSNVRVCVSACVRILVTSMMAEAPKE